MTEECKKLDDDTKHQLIARCAIDQLDNDVEPLTLAVTNRCSACVKTLLMEANIKIDITILQMVFHSKYMDTDILTLFLQRLLRDLTPVVRLIDAGCTMYHASFTRDIELMETLLKHGIDVNSRGYCNRTALHAAVDLNDLDLAKWILDQVDRDVDALDDEDKSALFDAAASGKSKLVRLLLESGAANPNNRHTFNEYTPLFAVFAFSINNNESANDDDDDGQRNFDECAELLLQHGAIPDNSPLDHNTLFDYALLDHRTPISSKCNKIVCLVAQLAVMGDEARKSVMKCSIDDHRSILSHLGDVYKSCKGLLELNVYGKLRLLDLLVLNDATMRNHARNRRLIFILEHYLCDALSKNLPYYARLLRKRVSKALYEVKLEDASISVLSRLFNCHYNLCYNFARQVVGYLSEVDLQQLCRV